MSIHTLPLGQLETNCYIIHNKTDALIIDPGGTHHKDSKPILAFIDQHQLKVHAILCTHLHYDHVFSVASLHEYLKTPIWASNKDLFLIDPEQTYTTTDRGFPEVTPFNPTHLKENVYTFGPYTCAVLETPGHTPGCLSLYFKSLNILFTGDLLFYHSVGRTDFPRSNPQDLHNSLQKKIFTLPAETIVYPGHGQTTSIHEEQTNNPYI